MIMVSVSSHSSIEGNMTRLLETSKSIPKLDSQNFLRVPDPSGGALIPTNLILPAQCSASNSSIGSNKSNTLNGHDSKLPWKIVILGEAGVGKTCLVKRYLSRCFLENYNPTVEDSYLHHMSLSDGTSHCIELLDTSGFYQFPAMRELNIRLGTAFILVFDVTKEETFKYALELRKAIIRIKGKDDVPIVIVGNKIDLESLLTGSTTSSLLCQQARVACESFRCEFAETSAKKDVNVDKVFQSIADRVSRALIEEQMREEALQMNAARRNSSISFIRRSSQLISRNITVDNTRRFSEPMCSDKQINRIKGGSNGKAASEKNSALNSSTPVGRKKQKNCVIQ